MQAVFILELLENCQATDTFLYSHVTHMFYSLVQRERLPSILWMHFKGEYVLYCFEYCYWSSF